MQKSAIITGITGQDGAYLAEFLLAKGYQVYGAYRRTSSVNFWRIEELGIAKHENLHLVEYDLTDPGASIRLLEKANADEVYNLAAQSFVGVSFDQPTTTTQITAIGALNLLEAIRTVNPKIKFYQASTSEMFGKVQSIPQDETTPFYPRSPYAIAKLFAHWTCVNYRESYNIYACSGILFNHESPLRGREFVTRKISDTIAKIKLQHADILELGNLNAKRDWGYAREYIEGMYLMLQAEKPEDFVLATQQSHTVREFVNMVCQAAAINIAWEGEGEKEIAIDTKRNKTFVRVNPVYYRPAEVDLLIGNSHKAKTLLGWQAKISVQELAMLMVEADLKRNRDGKSY